MKARWCHSILIVALTILGIAFQDETNIPNQQIVLQSNAVSISEVEAEQTISNIKEQLIALGAKQIEVKRFNRQLRITYYSESEVDSIKEALSENDDLKLIVPSPQESPSESPSSDSSLVYNLDVQEIQKDSNKDSLGGKATLQSPSKSDRFLNPYSSFAKNIPDSNGIVIIEHGAFVAAQNCSLLVDTTSHNIPEVRAGPLS